MLKLKLIANEKVSSSRDKGQEQMEAGEKGSDEVGCSEARSKGIFAVYTIPASSPAGSSISSELVMEDPGSLDNFIAHHLTRKLQLPSKAMVTSVKIVGKRRTIKRTSIYKVCLTDMQGRRHQIEAIGLDSLLAIAPASEVRELGKLS